MELRIKELRTKAGLTVEQLADKMGVSKSYLSEMENGKKRINADRIESCAKALGVRPFDLLNDPSISEEIRQHIDMLINLSPDVQAEVLRYARYQSEQSGE